MKKIIISILVVLIAFSGCSQKELSRTFDCEYYLHNKDGFVDSKEGKITISKKHYENGGDIYTIKTYLGSAKVYFKEERHVKKEIIEGHSIDLKENLYWGDFVTNNDYKTSCEIITVERTLSDILKDGVHMDDFRNFIIIQYSERGKKELMCVIYVD